ncbi:hypothetical protein [Breoghania sp. JC706]|uniref:hypothetical protein n=1 Tax=Breoghania sp. JC706 TaxID=3117732 RepID=UPI00300846AF
MTERREAGSELDDVSIRATLERILTSDTFSRSPKVSRLLAYLVDRRLAGAEEDLKEASIARHVFSQPDEFNPRSNPIVRVNASRLRNLLRLYYAGPGAGDTQRILLPDVGYRPDFPNSKPRTARTARAQAAEEPGAPVAAGGTDAPVADTTHSGGTSNGATATIVQPRPTDQPAQGVDATANPAGTATTGQPASGDGIAAAPGGLGMQLAAGRRRRPWIFDRQPVIALLVANLVLAGAFVIMAVRPQTESIRHVLSLPARAAENTKTAPMFMLCDPDGLSSRSLEGGYPVAIGTATFRCWPVQLRQADISTDPI